MFLSSRSRSKKRTWQFDEGSVFASSWAYLKRKGLEVHRGVLRQDAVDVFDLYRERGGAVYNG